MNVNENDQLFNKVLTLIYSKDIKDIIILSTSFTQSINQSQQSINQLIN